MWFGQNRDRKDSEWMAESTARPASRAEAQRMFNLSIVHHRMSPDRSYVDKVALWDGESYMDKFFCSNTCAMVLGYAAARAGSCTGAYNDAVEQRTGK